MLRDAVVEFLDRCDRASSLPRLGGMARANGVVIVSERFWAFAGVDGSLREGRMPSAPRPQEAGKQTRTAAVVLRQSCLDATLVHPRGLLLKILDAGIEEGSGRLTPGHDGQR